MVTMVEAWAIDRQNDINNGPYDKEFEVCDRHLELSRTPRAIGFLWLIGGIACIITMRAGSYLGLAIGVLGMIAIKLIEMAFTQKSKRDLHLICYVKRKADLDIFFALDLNTNELLYVQHHMDADKESADSCAFETVTLDFFKEYIRKCSLFNYEKVKDFTSETQFNLRNVQFGETKYIWIIYMVQPIEDKIHIGCFRVDRELNVHVKYAELDEQQYNKYMSHYPDIKRGYEVFFDDKNCVFLGTDIKCFSTVLTKDETEVFKGIFNGDNTRCNMSMHKFFSRYFINESEYEGNAFVADANGMKYIRQLVGEDRNKPFVPYSFDDNELIKPEIAEVKEQKQFKDNTAPTEEEIKCKKYGKYGIVCSLVGLLFPLAIPASIVLSVLSLRISANHGIPKENNAIGGLVICAVYVGLVLIGIFCS